MHHCSFIDRLVRNNMEFKCNSYAIDSIAPVGGGSNDTDYF